MILHQINSVVKMVAASASFPSGSSLYSGHAIERVSCLFLPVDVLALPHTSAAIKVRSAPLAVSSPPPRAPRSSFAHLPRPPDSGRVGSAPPLHAPPQQAERLEAAKHSFEQAHNQVPGDGMLVEWAVHFLIAVKTFDK